LNAKLAEIIIWKGFLLSDEKNETMDAVWPDEFVKKSPKM
jgi:hypothetical protein